MSRRLSRRCVFAILTLIALGGCASHLQRAKESAKRIAPKNPEEFARAFVKSLSAGNTEEAMQLFISRSEFLAHINGTDAQYARLRAKSAAELRRIANQLDGAKYVSVYTRTRDPEMIEPNSSAKLPTKTRTPCFNETRIWASANGKLYEVYLDVLLNVDGAWRFIELPRLRAR